MREKPEGLKNVCVVVDKLRVLLTDLRILFPTVIINVVCVSQ